MPRTQPPALPLLIAAAFAAACSPQVDPDYSGEPLASIRGAVMSEQTATAADVAVLWFTSEGDECTGPQYGCAGGGGGSEEAVGCVDACGEPPPQCQLEGQAEYGACVQACGWDYFFSIMWELCVNGGSGERVSVAGEFPAAFTLDLFQPPPESALLLDEGGLRLAYGWFIVADPEAQTITLDLNADSPPASIIGGSGTYALVYAADPIPAESAWGQFFGGALETGYHIVEATPGVSCEPEDLQPGENCVATGTTYAVSPDDLATEISVTLAPFGSIEWPGL